MIRNGTGCKICGSDPTACAVLCISKLTGFGPGLDTLDVGDSVNFVHSLPKGKIRRRNEINSELIVGN